MCISKSRPCPYKNQKDSPEPMPRAQDCDKSRCWPEVACSPGNYLHFCFHVHGSCFISLTKDSRRPKTWAMLSVGTKYDTAYGKRTFNSQVFVALEDDSEAAALSSLIISP